jgi:hypothetical protein
MPIKTRTFKQLPKRLCNRIALPKWPKSHEYEPAPVQLTKRLSPPVHRLNQPSFDASNRYCTPSTRIVGTRSGARSDYAPQVGSKAKRLAFIQTKAPSRRDLHRMEVAQRNSR